MARILLIEQQVIVREAIRRFLFPEHEVLASDRWPTSEELRAHDLAVIDTATLLRMDENREDVEAQLDQAQIPAVWLGSEDSGLPESDATRVFLRKPLEAKAFRSALHDLCAARMKSGGADNDTQEPERIIELTDVIEDGVTDEETD